MDVVKRERTPSAPTCAIIAIGNELVFGETVNTNASFIASQLTAVGIRVARVGTLPDESAPIVQALREAREDILILTGGLGPTDDDMTRQALSLAFDASLREDTRQKKRLIAFFRKRNRPMAAINLRQAQVPAGFKAVDNPYGTAPLLMRERPLLFCLPGVPREARGLTLDVVLPAVRRRFKLSPIYHVEIKTTGIGESSLAAKLGKISLPGGVTLAYLPELSGVTLRLSGTRPKAMAPVAALIKKRCGNYAYGGRGESLEKCVFDLFKRKRWTLALAESCTGGLVASKIVSIPGSSEVFKGGVVAYSNGVKSSLLDVNSMTLKRHGAVSPEVAIEMARGVRARLAANVGASITGIAGPGGGTQTKPVGLVYIAVVTPKGASADLFRLSGSREEIRERATAAALDLIRKRVLG